MDLKKVTFTNNKGEELSGRLELPDNQHPHNFVLFAHCFTCNKNLSAVVNISRELADKGFGVLRFDFTGLGESAGDFSDTNFSGNVEDLITAANWLKKNHQAPTILVGHSLGGAAVIFAAEKIESIKAIATISAPSDPNHIKKLLKSSIEEIETKGQAVVNLSGRDFTIKQQFLNDLKTKSLPDIVKKLRKAILVMHSPQDSLVGINNAEEIYSAARHPKSFISLDGADHLLTKKEDSKYVGLMISSWASKYLQVPEQEKIVSKTAILASLNSKDGFLTKMAVGNHFMVADEPIEYGGTGFGPSPYEFLSAGLAACTAMTIQMYAKQKKWEIDEVQVKIKYDKQHAIDCENCEYQEAKIDTFSREIHLKGSLDTKQRDRILEIADKCPVHKTLHNKVQVLTKLRE
ncbi:MAG: osmotically inducible protein C [Bacteroidetes bacterium HGW-Bacteroidetes-2]|jgi:putative redox protein|nr:MAG: osmotically inducible protein C [Bacteroidetes bacterium HGW-Bacteroidetes-8]PKP26672.1 MAG: osmotically inducible protein C [Bacteroidetes bacterium HGW-Bacteroidetes-2]